MQKRKVFLAVLVIFTVISSVITPSYADMTASSTYIMVNNKPQNSGTSNYYYNGILLTSAKELSDALGGTFSFDSEKSTGTLRQGENEIVFRLDNSIVKLNGKYVQAPAPLKIADNRFMVPARFAAERLGAEAYMRESKNTLLIFQPVNGNIVYQVVSGDTLWLLSQLFGTSVAAIKQINNLTSDMINIGQKLIIKNYTPVNSSIPAQTTMGATLRTGAGFACSVLNYLPALAAVTVTGKNGDWYKVITSKGNGYLYYTTLAITQDLPDSSADSAYFGKEIAVDTSRNFVTYSQYAVQKGDSLWSVSDRSGIPLYELASANGLTDSAMLYIGQILKIPVHNIAAKSTPGVQYGEVLDWFKEAQYVFSTGKIGKFIDIATGKSFAAQRTMGANHSDTETLTLQDTNTMKEIFGGSWNWNRRPFILEVDGRRFAVSVAGMPHAGVDGVPYLQNVGNRSDDWGYGPNYDKIPGNGMNGHFDVYFLNCLRHKDNQIDPLHQFGVLTAGGLR